jgi:hypothetical protein
LFSLLNEYKDYSWNLINKALCIIIAAEFVIRTKLKKQVKNMLKDSAAYC